MTGKLKKKKEKKRKKKKDGVNCKKDFTLSVSFHVAKKTTSGITIIIEKDLCKACMYVS